MPRGRRVAVKFTAPELNDLIPGNYSKLPRVSRRLDAEVIEGASRARSRKRDRVVCIAFFFFLSFVVVVLLFFGHCRPEV